MNYTEAMQIVVRTLPQMSVVQADLIARAFSQAFPVSLNTLEDRVAFARSRDDVMDCLPERKIAAIKALRTASQEVYGAPSLSLLDAKNTIDAICPFV